MMNIKVPKDATVMRVYDNGVDPRKIVFEDGDPKDYIWTTWPKSIWKSIDWMAGKVDDNNLTIERMKL